MIRPDGRIPPWRDAQKEAFVTIPSAIGAWSEYVATPGASGMHAILVRPHMGLELDKRRVAATIFDDFALRIAELCISQRLSAVIGHPDPLNALPALVPAAAHIHRAIETRSGSDLRVAVVTRDMRMRSIYRRLCVGPESLSNVIPAYAIGGDGVLSKLGSGGPRAATFFASSCTDLRAVGRLDLVVVDAPVPDMDRLNPNIPTIYLVRDPSAQEVTRLARTLPTFCWSADDVVQAPEVFRFDGPRLRETFDRLENIRIAAPARVQVVVAPSIADNASLFWADIGPLLNATRGSEVGAHLARSAFELYRELLTLAVPFALYERTYGPIKSRIDAIERASEWLRGSSRDLYLPTVALELRELASAIGEDPPKERALRRLLEPLVASGTVTIVVRDRLGAGMVRAWLDEQPRFASRVAAIPFSGLAEATPTRSAIVLGLAPTWARHIYNCGIARDIDVLAYSPGGGACVGGPSEAELVRRTLAYRAGYGRWLARPAAKANCWERLSGERLDVVDHEPNPPFIQQDDRTSTEPVDPDLPPELWAGVGDFHEADTSDTDDAHDGGRVGRGDGTSHATRLTFSEDRWALVQREGEVTVLDPASRTVVTIPTADLIVGMMLVSIDNRTKKDVLAKVLEVSADVPGLAIAAAWTQPWRAAIIEARRRFKTLSALHRALTNEGSTVQYQTVRLWMIGATICPDDPENVRRLGVVTEQPRLKDNYRNVHRAMETFRSAHGTMLRRIHEMALHYGTAAVAGRVDVDEVLDERSGLTAADLRDCIRLLPIERIEDAGLVPTVLVDRINTEESSSL